MKIFIGVKDLGFIWGEKCKLNLYYVFVLFLRNDFNVNIFCCYICTMLKIFFFYFKYYKFLLWWFFGLGEGKVWIFWFVIEIFFFIGIRLKIVFKVKLRVNIDWNLCFIFLSFLVFGGFRYIWFYFFFKKCFII